MMVLDWKTTAPSLTNSDGSVISVEVRRIFSAPNVLRDARLIPFQIKMMPRRLGGGDKAYYEYVEEAYDDANKGSA
jgi:hypothetical protein